MATYKSQYTGAQIDEAVGKANNIAANNGEATTADLSTLKVGDVNYKIPEGGDGGALYEHILKISFNKVDGYNNIKGIVSYTLITKDNTRINSLSAFSTAIAPIPIIEYPVLGVANNENPEGGVNQFWTIYGLAIQGGGNNSCELYGRVVDISGEMWSNMEGVIAISDEQITRFIDIVRAI